MELEEVLAALERGPAELVQLLNQREGEITPELATSAGAFAEEGLLNRDGEKALLGARAATDLHLWLGDRPNALKWLITVNEVLYVGLDTSENYLSVRRAMLDAIEKADEIGSAELAFKAAVLAAEAGFHAGEGTGEPDEWRRTVLADVAVARGRAPADPDEVWYPRLVYLIAVVGAEAMTAAAIEDDEQLKRSLRELASWVEARVPVDFVFDPDAKINAQIAGQLTALTADFA